MQLTLVHQQYCIKSSFVSSGISLILQLNNTIQLKLHAVMLQV